MPQTPDWKDATSTIDHNVPNGHCAPQTPVLIGPLMDLSRRALATPCFLKTETTSKTPLCLDELRDKNTVDGMAVHPKQQDSLNEYVIPKPKVPPMHLAKLDHTMPRPPSQPPKCVALISSAWHTSSDKKSKETSKQRRERRKRSGKCR